MTRALLTLVISTICLGATASCGDGETSCVADSDCFKGEACVEQVCAPASDTGNNGTSNNTVPNNTEPNNTAPDNTAPNNTASNSSTNNSDVETGICLVDPFNASCDSDDNDDSHEYIYLDNGAPGCNSGWDDFEGAETTLEDKQLCALETRDRYSVNLVPCDNKTFAVEVTMTPTEDCDPDDYAFNVSVGGNDCEEPGDTVRCDILEDGSKRVIAFVEPSNSLSTAYIEVAKSNNANVHFDYELHLLVRE